MKRSIVAAVFVAAVAQTNLAALATSCETDKKLHDVSGDPIAIIGSGFFSLFNRAKPNTFVPVVFSTLNTMTAEARYAPEPSLESCKDRLRQCGGKFLSGSSYPNIKAYCVKTNARKQIEKIFKVK